MGSTVKISSAGQVRVPKEILDKLHAGKGDYLEFQVEQGVVVVRAKKLIDAEQAWFWSAEWQEAERAAEKDIKEGRTTKTFGNAQEGIAHLRAKRTARVKKTT